MDALAFFRRHSVATYYAMVFGISWGGMVAIFGPGVFLGTTVISFTEASPLAYVVYLAGPAVAGIALLALVGGRAGLRDLLSRLRTWRVPLRWYAVALLTAPILSGATGLLLSAASPMYLPAILTADDKVRLLMTGLGIGLVVSIFEETGWTGFAIPQLRARHGLITTGSFMGVLWGLWHLPLFAGQASGSTVVPPVLYLAVLLFSWLVPYRILMVWVYDHTKSLLLLMLMHLTIDVGAFVLRPGVSSDLTVVPSNLAFAAALWAGVALVALRGRLQVSGRREALPA